MIKMSKIIIFLAMLFLASGSNKTENRQPELLDTNQIDLSTNDLTNKISDKVQQTEESVLCGMASEAGPSRVQPCKKSADRHHFCEQCNKSFTQKGHLRRHQRIHTGEKPHSCNECGKNFSRRCSLRRHLVTHRKKKSYNCRFCNKSFKVVVSLRRHELSVHPTSKSGSRVPRLTPFKLKLNQRTHSGKKPYSCDQCKKSFPKLKNLVRHSRIHAGEWSVKCDLCSMWFSCIDSLRHHEQTIHSSITRPVTKEYVCMVCKENFGIRFLLKIHKRLHTGKEQPV